MRFWFGGPRIFGIRTGVSFGPEDFRSRGRRRPVSDSQPRGSFVYVVRGEHQLVKIGVTTNPDARLAQLRTGSAFPIEYAFVGMVSGDAYAVEAAAHALLDRQRLNGEWFDVTPELAVAAVMGAAAKLNQQIGNAPASGGLTYSDPRPKWGAGSIFLLLVMFPIFFIAFLFAVTLFMTLGGSDIKTLGPFWPISISMPAAILVSYLFARPSRVKAPIA